MIVAAPTPSWAKPVLLQSADIVLGGWDLAHGTFLANTLPANAGALLDYMHTTAMKRTRDLLAGVGINAASVTINAKYFGSSPSKTLTISATMPYKPLIGFVPVPANISYAMMMMFELH